VLQEEIERLLTRKDLRSADRAYLQTMLKTLKGGSRLSQREREVLWTFITRYQGTLEANL